MGRRLRYIAEYLVFRLAICLVQAAPPSVCRAVARWLAGGMRYLPRKVSRYNIARENILAAFPGTDDETVERIIHEMWVHLLQMVTEIIHLPRKLRLSNVLDLIEFRHRVGAVGSLCSGRPVLMLCGHFGNWEMGVRLFGQFGFPMGVVGRNLDNPYLDRWMETFRQSTGHHTIPKNGGASQMTAVLEQGGALALLGDQDAGGSGVFVDFFGRPASTHKSIALLAIEYDALIVVGYSRRLNESLPNGWPRYEVGCEEVVDPRDYQTSDGIREMTQRYTAALQRAVARSPEQYFWVHRRWKSQPRARKKVAAKAA